MASRARNRRTIDIWPGYVDALAALLMVLIFVLLVFVVAQALLSRTVSQQDLELISLHRQIAELTRDLGLAEEANLALEEKTSALSTLISELMGEKVELDAQIEELGGANAALAADLAERDRRLAVLEQDLDGLRAARAALEAETATLNEALTGSRDRAATLAGQLQQREAALDEERRISAAARAELALLNRQVLELRRRLEEIATALAAAEAVKQEQAGKIEDLGKRLNIALAREVNRLARYQSEFFGRLREVLGENPDIRVVGDRFVFSSELLFASGTADLGADGRQQLVRFAATLRDLARRIPADLDWVLRVDGHTDRVPISNERYASNWELSTARALSVVRFLIDQEIQPRRLVAAGFGEHHPLDPGATPQALARNRRIEFKLTAR